LLDHKVYISSVQIIETSNSLLQKDSNDIVWLSFPYKTRHTLVTMKEHLNAVSELDNVGKGVLLCV